MTAAAWLRVANPVSFVVCCAVNALGGAGVIPGTASVGDVRAATIADLHAYGTYATLLQTIGASLYSDLPVLAPRLQVSGNSPTLITPASFAFAIWGGIYVLMALFCVISAVPWLRAGD
eukprot:SAG22_NODE_13000_length_422_cov_0.786378_1_plen_118_part_10